MQRTLIVVTGQEGAGKSAIMSALLPHLSCGAKLDAEDVGQVQPFAFDQPFLELMWSNVVTVITSFWDAGYRDVIAGSFLDGDTHQSLQQFRARLPEGISIYLIHLRASKPVRDQRRIARAKPSTKEWRDQVDARYPSDDTSLGDNASDYRYIPIDNSTQQLRDTVAAILKAIPEVFDDEPG